jgi:type IV pilus assembly protein PilE
MSPNQPETRRMAVHTFDTMESARGRHCAGFTLIELVVAMAIMALLVMIAVPSYNNSVIKARRTDGQSALMDALTRQERFFTENGTYTTDLAQASIATASAEGYYTLSAAACPGSSINACVVVTATPTGPQSSDGALTLDSRGRKTPADKW